ncbi:MAG: histidine triad nucleotide-binding protein [Candidatus Paceibacterota bacterium]
MNCLFCEIIKGEISAEKVYEDDFVFAFRDIHPIAPVHILIIPKKHIASINNLVEEDVKIMGNMFLSAKKIAEDVRIAEKGYKLLVRTGRDGGQEVPHIHMHLLGGARLHEDIGPVK